MILGLIIFLSAGATIYVSRGIVQKRAEAIAQKSLSKIMRQTVKQIRKVERACKDLTVEIEENLDNPDTMFTLSRKVLIENKMIKGCSISFEPFFFPQKGKYFSAYSYNGAGVEGIVSEQEGSDDYQYFCMDWYLIPQQLNSSYWIEPYEDTSTPGINIREIMTTFGYPIRLENDSLVGVCTVDVPMEWLQNFISSQHPLPKSYCILVGRGGTFIVHPDSTKLLDETILTPTLEKFDPELNRLCRAMISGETGFQTLKFNDVDSHVFYIPFAKTGWSIALVCPNHVLMYNFYILAAFMILLMALALFMMMAPICCRIRCRFCGQPAATILLVPFVLISCQEKGDNPNSIGLNVIKTETEGRQAQVVDSLLEQSAAIDDKHFFACVDSLESAGIISQAMANYKRSDHYNEKEMLRTAALYAQKALDDKGLVERDPILYYNVVQNYCVAQFNQNNLEKCLDMATKGYSIASKDTTMDGRCWTYVFLEKICSCQLYLERQQEGEKTIEKIRLGVEKLNTDYPTQEFPSQTALLIANNIVSAYMTMHQFNKIGPWLEVTSRTLEKYAATDAVMENYVKYLCMDIINKALVLYQTGHKDEAEAECRKFLNTEYAQSYYGITDLAYYFQETEQWSRYLDMRLKVDSALAKEDVTPTLEYIIRDQSSTFYGYYMTGRKQEALDKACQIFEMLDTVQTHLNENNAAELAIIYETQQKEEEIAQQKASLAQQRTITFTVIFALIAIALTIILILRHRAGKHLEIEHEKLLEAYDQLEETTTVKERIESELRIARDIQQSMLPSTFPKREGLEMFASMTPAREVGGDLYDYLLQDDKLYFCVGDVSGKGVPASLFMAQTIRLFRALAKQHHEPEQIATEMNDELSENNENGMFVTMFIGLLDIPTGHLHFCNAGHNPPVIGGDENHGSYLEMESNAPIGLWQDLQFIGEEIETLKGHPFFVYTDGLNEAENRKQQQFGDDSVLRVLRETRFRSPEQIIEIMTDAVNLHRYGAEPNDDLTMMCINVL